MKRKGPRDIPDFSRHPKSGRDGTVPQTTDAKPARPNAPPQPAVKPRATSAKSGRRGQ
jgi:hypothetical protein